MSPAHHRQQSHCLLYMDVSADSKMGQISPKWDRQIWDFLRSVSVHYGAPRQNVQKLILKIPDLSVPFGANQTIFGAKPAIPV